MPQPLQSVRGWRLFQSCRPSAVRSLFPPSACPSRVIRISYVLCLVSFACADPRPVARSRALVVCGYPVPPSRSGQYRGYGPACLTFVGARLRSPIGLAAASGAVSSYVILVKVCGCRSALLACLLDPLTIFNSVVTYIHRRGTRADGRIVTNVASAWVISRCSLRAARIDPRRPGRLPGTSLRRSAPRGGGGLSVRPSYQPRPRRSSQTHEMTS